VFGADTVPAFVPLAPDRVGPDAARELPVS
jgi:hypothetical protein